MMRGPPSSNVTSASAVARSAARAPSPSRAATRGGAGRPWRSRNTRSLANVRRSHTTVSASTAARSGQATQSGPGAAHQ